MMSANKSILFFRLEGALQSWGDRSKWNERDSGTFPTKSGIVGLIAAAMGIERSDSRITMLSNSIKMAVRADRIGKAMVDFHTVTSEKLISANGGSRTGGNTFITRRTYIQDASFLVGIQANITFLEEIRTALESPKWPVFLGRKCCIPSIPLIGVISDEYDSLHLGMEKYPFSLRRDERIVYEIDSNDEVGYNRNDEIMDLNGKIYFSRRVKKIVVKEE